MCGQKLTRSQFSLPHVAYRTKMDNRKKTLKTKRKPLSSPESVKTVRWIGWCLWWEGFLEKLGF